MELCHGLDQSRGRKGALRQAGRDRATKSSPPWSLRIAAIADRCYAANAASEDASLMKTLALVLALAAGYSFVDDPPPEPPSCPLCGGDANLHSRVVIAIELEQSQILLHALRW